jgi:hypothetical protein
MTSLLTLLITFYLGFHARRMSQLGTPRPEDRKDAEVADGAGELGFFPPYSWWPLWCGVTLGVIVFAVAMQAWWLYAIAIILGAAALSRCIYENYRGVPAHRRATERRRRPPERVPAPLPFREGSHRSAMRVLGEVLVTVVNAAPRDLEGGSREVQQARQPPAIGPCRRTGELERAGRRRPERVQRRPRQR